VENCLRTGESRATKLSAFRDDFSRRRFHHGKKKSTIPGEAIDGRLVAWNDPGAH